MPYNLESPNTLLEPIDPANIARWYVRETIQVESEAIRHVSQHTRRSSCFPINEPLRTQVFLAAKQNIECKETQTDAR
jgi:hypothetical protein